MRSYSSNRLDRCQQAKACLAGFLTCLAMIWSRHHRSRYGCAPASALPASGDFRDLADFTVDAAATPRVGLKSFPQTLPLGDHEVVLTFDDGPWPPTTRRVLAALARECVRATFFLIGKSASGTSGPGAADRGRWP